MYIKSINQAINKKSVITSNTLRLKKKKLFLDDSMNNLQYLWNLSIIQWLHKPMSKPQYVNVICECAHSKGILTLGMVALNFL